MHQTFDACALVLGAQRFDQLAGRGTDLLGRFFRQSSLRSQCGNAFGFRTTISGGDRLPHRVLLADRRRKSLENRIGGDGYGVGHGAMLANENSPERLCPV